MGWKATDEIEAIEGHCDIYAFKENFGSSVADGLEWDKTRGKNTQKNCTKKIFTPR